MAFNLPREPGTTETLQCIACAARQEIGPRFDANDLVDLMKQDGTHPKEHAVYNHAGIENKYATMVKQWVTDPAKPELLQEWLNSSIWIANSLVDEGIHGGSYTFYRQNQFPAPGKSFKDLFVYLRDKIKADGRQDPRWLKTTAGKIYSEIEINDDKWNPADIIAVKDSKKRTWQTLLTQRGFLRWVEKQDTGSKSTLRKDMKEFSKMRGKDATTAINKLKIVDSMSHLYDYNKLIYRGMKDKTFVPISLKKADSSNPQCQQIFVSEPKDLEKYFNMKVNVYKTELLPGNKKAKVYFKLEGLGPEKKLYFDMRGFESTASIADIQIQLMEAAGGSAAHGKITLPVTTQQIRLSGGKKALDDLKRMRNTIFKKTFQGRTDVAKRRREKMTSGIHGFTDYRIFQQLQRDVHNAFKNPRDNTLTAEVEEVKLCGDYVDKLSKGQTKKRDFIKNATGDKFYGSSGEKLNFEIGSDGNVLVGKLKKNKKGEIPGLGTVSIGPKRLGLDMSHSQVKYMKDKVQSYEMAWVITKSGIADQAKENIMKSMYMYAASKGFALFRTPTASFFMLHGPYWKCAA